MSAPLSEFYDHLMPELPGITTPMVDLHLREIARDFCDRTTLWRVPFDAVNTVATQPAYDLSPSEGNCEVVKLHKVVVNAALLFDDSWYPDSTTDRPKYNRASPPFTLDETLSLITLIADETPTAAVTGGLVITGSLKPKRDAAVLPDLFKGAHREALRVGTLARVMAIGKKPWTDREMALDHRNTYERLVAHAAFMAATGNTRKALRSRKWG